MRYKVGTILKDIKGYKWKVVRSTDLTIYLLPLDKADSFSCDIDGTYPFPMDTCYFKVLKNKVNHLPNWL